MRKVEKRLRERIKELEKINEELHADREKYRRYFQSKFRWFIELHGGGKYPSMPWLIEDMAKFINTVKGFWWAS